MALLSMAVRISLACNTFKATYGEDVQRIVMRKGATKSAKAQMINAAVSLGLSAYEENTGFPIVCLPTALATLGAGSNPVSVVTVYARTYGLPDSPNGPLDENRFTEFSDAVTADPVPAGGGGKTPAGIEAP